MNIAEAIKQAMKDAENEPMNPYVKGICAGSGIVLVLFVGAWLGRVSMKVDNTVEKPAEVQLVDPTRMNQFTDMSRWHDPEYMVTCWGATPVNGSSGAESGSAKAIFCMKDSDLVRRDPDCVPGTETEGKTVNGVEFPGVCVDKRNYR